MESPKKKMCTSFLFRHTKVYELYSVNYEDIVCDKRCESELI